MALEVDRGRNVGDFFLPAGPNDLEVQFRRVLVADHRAGNPVTVNDLDLALFNPVVDLELVGVALLAEVVDIAAFSLVVQDWVEALPAFQVLDFNALLADFLPLPQALGVVDPVGGVVKVVVDLSRH